MESEQEVITPSEPLEEEWLSGICIQRYDNVVRLVQPRDGQLAPDSVTIPKAWGGDIAEFIEAWSDR